MEYWQAFFSLGYLLPLIFIALLYPLAFWGYDKFESNMEDQPAALFILEGLGRPVLQALLALAFIFFSYPAMFGMMNFPIPDLQTALVGSEKSVNKLLNILVLVGFFLSAIPVLWRYKVLLLALQIILACQVIFSWSLAAAGSTADVEFLPSAQFVLKWLFIALILHGVIAVLGRHIGKWLDERFDTRGADILFEMSVGFFMQGFVVLAYTMFLGRQISII